MYDLIEQKRSVSKLYTESLIGRGDITIEEAEQVLKDYQQQLERVFREVREGDSQPDEFIPRLVDLMMDCKLPAEKMMTFYELADINQAARDSNEGRTIKPVLRMPH